MHHSWLHLLISFALLNGSVYVDIFSIHATNLKIFRNTQHIRSCMVPCCAKTPRNNNQSLWFYDWFYFMVATILKVLTNEKRGGWRVISFDRSPFKLFSRKFSKESVQAPSCERHKTTQRTLFLLFANNFLFPLTLLCLAATHFWHRELNWNIGIVRTSSPLFEMTEKIGSP